MLTSQFRHAHSIHGLDEVIWGLAIHKSLDPPRTWHCKNTKAKQQQEADGRVSMISDIEVTFTNHVLLSMP